MSVSPSKALCLWEEKLDHNLDVSSSFSLMGILLVAFAISLSLSLYICFVCFWVLFKFDEWIGQQLKTNKSLQGGSCLVIVFTKANSLESFEYEFPSLFVISKSQL